MLTAGPASATMCPATPSCAADGQTFTITGTSFTSEDGLTFLAEFTTANQSNATIAAEVEAFLTDEGYANVMYLGRQDGSGLVDGDSITTASSNGGLSGTWTLDPGTTGDVGAFIAIHAGGGQTDELYEINNPGLSGTWTTEDTANLSNFDLFGTPVPVPVPKLSSASSLTLLAIALVGLGFPRRRRNSA